MSWTRSVFSDPVQSVGWNDDTQEIEITWKNGRVSTYEGADEGVALALANAPSVGQMIHRELIPAYRHRYLK